MTTTNEPYGQGQPTVAVNCEKDGHCWVPGTGLNTLWCSKCGKYYVVTKIESPVEKRQ